MRPISAGLSFADRRALGLGRDNDEDADNATTEQSASRTASASVRLPSTRGRSHLTRTSASGLECGSRHSDLTSSESEDDDDGSVLITELKGEVAQQQEAGGGEWNGVRIERIDDAEDSEDEGDDRQMTEEDWDTDLEIEGVEYKIISFSRI